MLEGLEPPLKDSVCIVARKAADLSKEDQQILETAFNDPRWTASSLVRALAERGFVVGDTALRKHLRKDCACARAA
jgi:hypothetical protein